MAGSGHSSEHDIPVHILEFPLGSAASPVRSLLSFRSAYRGWQACSVARRISFLLGRRVCAVVAMRTRACAMRSRSGSGLGFPVTVIRCCRPLGRDSGAAGRRRRGRVIAGPPSVWVGSGGFVHVDVQTRAPARVGRTRALDVHVDDRLNSPRRRCRLCCWRRPSIRDSPGRRAQCWRALVAGSRSSCGSSRLR